jgi:hypothetical protein
MANKLQELSEEAKNLGLTVSASDDEASLTKMINAETTRIKSEGDIADAKLNISKKRDKDEKKYSEEEMRALFNKWKKEDDSKGIEVDDDKPKARVVTIPRYNKKFIVAFANLNDDEYFPDKIIMSQNIFDDKTKTYIPNVRVIFDDDTVEVPSRLTIPFETILKISTKETCTIIERKQKDASVRFGAIAVQEVKADGYNMTETGEIVQGKMKRVTETFLVETPNGQQLWVGPEVINWKPAPQQQN